MKEFDPKKGVELLKVASEEIQKLTFTKTALENQLNRLKLAQDIAIELVERGQLTVEDFPHYVKEAQLKDIEELERIKTALDFSDSVNNMEPFRVSNESYESNGNPIIDFLLS